jgi:hypothetical protein
VTWLARVVSVVAVFVGGVIVGSVALAVALRPVPEPATIRSHNGSRSRHPSNPLRAVT